jgi:hypothetical protein
MRLTVIILALLLSACADDGCSYTTTTRYNTKDLLTGEITSVLCNDLICPNQPVSRTCRPG